MTRRQVVLLIAPILTTFMVLLDVSVVSVALPSIQTQLGGSVSAGQWVLDSYTLMLCGLSLSGGAIADRYGRKRLLIGGTAVFTLGSAGCALSVSLPMLVACRAVQGVGAAVLIPGALSILVQCFPDPAQRARALGLWSTIGGGLSFVLGPVVGGLLVDGLGWSSIFWINLPIGALTIALAARVLPESADPEHAALDPLGQLLTIGSLSALAGALIEGSRLGWRAPLILALFGLAALGLVALVVVEARHPRPMLPVRLLAGRAFGLVTAASFVLGFSAYAVFFFVPAFFQLAQGRSAAVAGAFMLPMSVALGVTPVLAGRWVARSGPRPAMLVGYLAMTASLAALLGLSPGSAPAFVGAVIVVLGVGMGLAIISTNAAGLEAVSRQRSGIAGGVISTARQCGQTMGIALLGSLIALRVAHPSPSYASAYTDGLRLACAIAGAVTLVIVVLVAVLRSGQPASARGCSGSPGSSLAVTERTNTPIS